MIAGAIATAEEIPMTIEPAAGGLFEGYELSRKQNEQIVVLYGSDTIPQHLKFTQTWSCAHCCSLCAYDAQCHVCCTWFQSPAYSSVFKGSILLDLRSKLEQRTMRSQRRGCTFLTMVPFASLLFAVSLLLAARSALRIRLISYLSGSSR